jgi:hypothetical protein
MVEPESEKKEAGTSFRVRYAVRLNIRVDCPGLGPAAQIARFDMVKGEKREPAIQTQVGTLQLWIA